MSHRCVKFMRKIDHAFLSEQTYSSNKTCKQSGKSEGHKQWQAEHEALPHGVHGRKLGGMLDRSSSDRLVMISTSPSVTRDCAAVKVPKE